MLGARVLAIEPQPAPRPEHPSLVAPTPAAVRLGGGSACGRLTPSRKTPAARAAGVSLFLEPLNRYEAYIVNRVEQGAAIADRSKA